MKSARNATVLVVVIAAAWLLWKSWPAADQPSSTLSPDAPGWHQAGAANPFGQGSSVVERSAQIIPAIGAQAIDLESSSLTGTQPDGDWGANALGTLRASYALRQRFDYYLSLIGEMPLASIEALFRAAAEKDLQQPAKAQVLALWSSYVQLQQHPWKYAVNVQKPETWSAALIERQIQRRLLLGADVADAFYAEEDAKLQQMLTQVQSGQNGQGGRVELIGTPATHPQASEREAALQAQWQHWEQRLQAARSQLQAYKLAPELSAPQRQQAIEHYLASQFLGTELVRARALLGV